jgi:ribose transport system substrate-binding protein
VIATGIDPASSTARNPVITRACNAGIIVVIFDSAATAPCECGRCLVRRLRHGAGHGRGEGVHGNGNVAAARGIAGTGSDTTSTSASLAELKKYTGIKVIATINGDGSPDTTPSALARSWRVSARSTTAEDYLKLQMERHAIGKAAREP